VPIVPDDTGYVAATSNSLGIHGSFAIYSDCTDLKNTNCSVITTPSPITPFTNVGGKLCTSGTTSTATKAWGAGILLELNDGPPQEPYNLTSHGITGFCFVLSGAIPSTSIRFEITTTEVSENGPMVSITSLGASTVLLTQMAYPSWATSTPAFDATQAQLLQWMVPANNPTNGTATVVPWDFCLEGVTAITQ
jgi:hypothetical protein